MQSERKFISGFEECFGELEDGRQQSKVDHPLIEILFLAVVAIAGSAFSWRMIESFGKAHLSILREYYPFKNGIPSDDTIRRVFEVLDPAGMGALLQKYFSINLSGEHIAIDGKTLRGSRYSGSRAIHFLNVYASCSGITLFGKEVDEKKNEISVIPEAIDCLDIKGAIVTIDAMGCQRSIAAKIKDKGADYVLGLKKNQASLYYEVETAFASNATKFFNMEVAHTTNKGHGREETRTCRIIRDFSKIPHSKDWPSIASVIEIKRKIATGDNIQESTSYYISSSIAKAEKMMEIIRSHWNIESMHWTLDVVFKEDASGAHKGNIPANLAITRRFILNILNSIKTKKETRPTLMRMIGWSPDYLRRFINILMNYS